MQHGKEDFLKSCSNHIAALHAGSPLVQVQFLVLGHNPGALFGISS